MNLGREIVACALRDGSLKPFIDAGIHEGWLTSREDLTRNAIFTDVDLGAYGTLLRHWTAHSKMPSLDMFHLSHPAASYRLPSSAYTAAELIEVFEQDRARYISQVEAGNIADLAAAGDTEGFLAAMDRAARLIRQSRRTQGFTLVWDAADYDVEERLNRVTPIGIPIGIPELDEQFRGFQDGNLITLLGRAKAGKTSHLILSALHAFLGDDERPGKRVMIVTVEINALGVSDRLDCFGAQVSLTKYAAGLLDKEDPRAAQKLRKWRKEYVGEYDGGAMVIVQPTGGYTVTDLEYDIDLYQPEVVYVDGFYFMLDRLTGKNGGSWEGHDNLAREMKELAMRRNLPVIVSHQVREKQLTGKKGAGIDDGAMMGGTGLIMASDMVLGFDADESEPKVHTISCTRSRTGYLRTVKGTWDWSTCTFTVGNFDDDGEQRPDVDRSKYARSGKGHGDEADDF